MDPKQLFINSAGRLHSIWRLAIFVVAFIFVMLLLGTAARIVYAVVVNVAPGLRSGNFFQNMVFRLTMLAAALLAGYACSRALEGLPWRSLGLWFHVGWWRDLLVGSLIGILSLAFATAIATVGGGLTFTFSGREAIGRVTQTLISSALLFIVAALGEEALFRGYPLQTLTRAKLVWLGVFLTSVPFAAVHLDNPNVAAGFTFINTALAGVWFAVAYLRTRNLWFPLGVHWAWNWALGSLFGLPVSGITELAPHPLMQGKDLGPAWLTGGAYGIEGGIACTVALLLSTLFIWRTKLVEATPEMKMLSSQENPVANVRPAGPPDPPLVF